MADNKPPQHDDWDDSRFWVLGIFYYNAADKRLLPPKRSGLGWTINFANPYSIGLMLLFVILITVLVKFLKLR